MVVERVIVDTNVLIAATDSARPGHLAARSLIESDPRALCVSGQVLREFLAVATRSVEHNGLSLTGAVAVVTLGEVTSTLDVVEETASSRRFLHGLVGSGRAAGQQVHDANLVAVAVEHGATTIVTANPHHFARFVDLISIEELN
ncbi:type II toxin-antitoxin system VapC family toxin [Nocardioides sp.]|uniref:type II toxin-antitoxin system VapC family toxin n=1 Tax=Nocardioides sp. TaxID=35761 RepID=UPI0039E475B2